MEIKQVYEILNKINLEVLGVAQTEEGTQTPKFIIKEDLSNIVSLGTEVLNANSLDKYANALVDHIGKMIFVDRIYNGSVPSVLKDAWEYGAVLEKVTCDLFDATENESWELRNGESYDQNIFYQPKIKAKFFNQKVTYEVDISITDRQMKSAFSSATQMNAFISMIYNAVNKTMTLNINNLILRTINNFIGETLADAFPSGTYANVTSKRAINLLKLYKDVHPTSTITASTCMNDVDFLKFASVTLKKYVKRLSVMSKVFNIGGQARFTPNDLLHVVLLDEFTSNTDVYLQSDVYHNEMTALPKYESVVYWQGSGENFDFADTSKIDITTSSGADVTISGVLGVMFDNDALMVCNEDRRITTHRNDKAEFTNEYHKWDCGYYNDLNENFIVFYVA